MSIERIILIATWVVVIVLLISFVPKQKLREALLLFCTSQALTWSLSLFFVEFGWVDNPVREFSIAAKSNFTFNYVLYPTIQVLYGLYYPLRKQRWRKAVHVVVFPLATTIFTDTVETYTRLIDAKPFLRYALFFIFLTALYLVHKYVRWFFWQLNGRKEKMS